MVGTYRLVGRLAGPPGRCPESFEIVQEVIRALVSGWNVRCHRRHDDVAQRFRNRGLPESRGPDQIASAELVEIARGWRVVRKLAGKHLVHRDAQRVEIGRKHRFPVELLGGHVRGAPDHRRAVRRDLEESRGSKVRDLEYASVRHQDIWRAEIAMNDSLSVGVAHGTAYLLRIGNRQVCVEGAPIGDHVLERLALDVFHHDEEDVVLFLGCRDRNDVGVVEGGKQSWLPEELGEIEILLVRHLDRDIFVDPRVAREVHNTESATTQRGCDLVLPKSLTAKQHLVGSV